MRPASLRAKLLWGTILVITLVMTGVFVVVDHRQRVAIVDEFQRRGEVLARNLAAISYGPLLLYNYTALEQNVTQAAAEDDVRYALVLDADGKVAVHSGHPERVGSALEGAVPARAAAAGEPLIQETVTPRGESIYDFAVPVLVEALAMVRPRARLAPSAPAPTAVPMSGRVILTWFSFGPGRAGHEPASTQ